MKKNSKSQLINNEHKLLSIKEIMDNILRETEGIPVEVKNSIIQTRDISWKAFIKEQEKSMSV